MGNMSSFYDWNWGWDDGAWEEFRGSCSGVLGIDGTGVYHRPGLHSVSGVKIKNHGSYYH